MARLSASTKEFLRSVPDGACVSDAKCRLVYLNPAAEEILGVSCAKAAGTSLCGLLSRGFQAPEARRAAGHCPLRRGGTHESFTLEGRFLLAARGKKKAAEKVLSVRCMNLSGSPGMRLTLLTDVTDRAAAEKRREDWRAMAVHDLRAPLTNIYAVLRDLQCDAEQPAPPPPDAQSLDIATRSCRRMMGMLELYLAVSRFDACMMPVARAPVDAAAFLREAVDEQTPLAEERGVRVVVNAPKRLPALGDPQLLSRALQNLLNNALKFSERGSAVRVTAGRDAHGRPAVTISDSGPGIPSCDLTRIFDRYSQTGSKRRLEGAGTGLGLAFCRQAVAAMQGELVVESSPGQGSAFTITLDPPPSDAQPS